MDCSKPIAQRAGDVAGRRVRAGQCGIGYVVAVAFGAGRARQPAIKKIIQFKVPAPKKASSLVVSAQLMDARIPRTMFSSVMHGEPWSGK